MTLPGDQITSITAVTERGEAPGVYAYKIASAEPYCRRLEAGYFADKKISRRRYVNVAAYPPEQRQQVLLRKLEQAAARYRRLEVVLTGAHRLPLYAGRRRVPHFSAGDHRHRSAGTDPAGAVLPTEIGGDVLCG